MAIHKSVASFVDKEYREKATSANCYTRKESKFLPQFDAVMNPAFRQTSKDKTSYFEYNEDFISSDVMLRRYVNHIFQYILSSKGK